MASKPPSSPCARTKLNRSRTRPTLGYYQPAQKLSTFASQPNASFKDEESQKGPNHGGPSPGGKESLATIGPNLTDHDVHFGTSYLVRFGRQSGLTQHRLSFDRGVPPRQVAPWAAQSAPAFYPSTMNERHISRNEGLVLGLLREPGIGTLPGAISDAARQ